MKLRKIKKLNKNFKLILGVIVLFFVSFSLFIIAMVFGTQTHSLPKIIEALTHRNRSNSEDDVIWANFYKLLAMFLVITAFSIGGLLMQNVTKNSLASPGVMGMTQAGKLGLSAASFYAVNISIAGVYWLVLISSAVPLVILFLMIRFSKNRFSGLSVAFIGIALGVIMSSIEWFLMYQNNQGDLFISSFLNSAFIGISKQKLVIMGTIIGVSTLLVFIFSKRFSLLEAGNELSNSVGSKANMTRLLATLMVVVSVPAAMLLGGNIMFIGMMVPHISKFLIKTKKYHLLIPTTIFVGSIIMFGTTWVSSQIYVHFHKSINVSAVIELIAAPAFMILARKARI